ncbi:ATP-binding protein [Rhodococcus sp. BP-316]|uniref:ATP-binding protein n=1 Tax=Rhodococcus sp. BP-316 TaxID=2739445 RepID=UPI0021C01C6C|nr:type IV secretion system protein VirB4 [Rhodococcus sp. BP-316]MBY6682322.1 ATP-binding protein [Rhodococcus sp. BP-316]
MSKRLGSALTEYLTRTLDPRVKNFVLLEGLPIDVADGMSSTWDNTLPRLAIVSNHPALFGAYALVSASGTQLRNRHTEKGVVLVLCDGAQVPDRQSLTLFESVTPSMLLRSAEGIAIIAQQSPPISLDGSARSVREAIITADLSVRPSGLAVSQYFDALATGTEPVAALPALGAFKDKIDTGSRVDSERILDNLTLAARRMSDDVLRPNAFAEIRRRAESTIARRPGCDAEEAKRVADLVMNQLQSGSADILETLYFDEAQEILEKRARGLSEVVKEEIRSFKSNVDSMTQIGSLPWKDYEKLAGEIGRGSGQRVAASNLCSLDDSLSKKLFTKPTRTKLERLLRDKSVNGSNPSCPEAAIVRAAQQLGGLIDRVQVLAPSLPTVSSSNTQTGAGSTLTLACARFRLGGLMQRWANAGGTIDGLLLRAATDDDLLGVDAAFEDAGLANGALSLAVLQLRLHAVDGSSVQVDWRPDLDDVAMLRAAMLFAEVPALTLSMTESPSLSAFCGRGDIKSEPVESGDLLVLARQLQELASASLRKGLNPPDLQAWSESWSRLCASRELAGNASDAGKLALAGAVRSTSRSTALSAFAPMKAEWLSQYMQVLWDLITQAEEPLANKVEASDAVATANAIARTTAAHHPAHVRLTSYDRVLLPTSEGRVWSVFGGLPSSGEDEYAGLALNNVVRQLLVLQPEVAGHLRCLAWGPGAADLLVKESIRLIGSTVGRVTVERIEVFCIGASDSEKPSAQTLALADDLWKNDRSMLQLRYVEDLDKAQVLLRPNGDHQAVHLALVTGLTQGGDTLIIESPEVAAPVEDVEVLFAPRVWQRAQKDRRTLLMPPATSVTGTWWLRLQNAVEEEWPEANIIQVPEVRTGASDVSSMLRQVHKLALWVATLDRYATRDSLEQALGKDAVAILHQERRLSGDSPLSLVLSQQSGGPADRAIGRSLRAAGIIKERDVAFGVGRQLREVASQGYGILALQAATSGAGINELVGHSVAFSMLATAATPWPLPPGCRVLLVSLDEYKQWFPGKRADLLAIALDTADNGVHIATIEVKARRSDESDAAAGALDQLHQTLAATRWAAYPESGSVHSRLWLNRIAEAAYAVARESRFKLTAAEIDALEEFRLGRGSLEWAGLGLIFGPKVETKAITYRYDVANDIVPIVIHSVPLTQELLEVATSTSLTDLRTIAADKPPLQSSRKRRRPESSPKPEADGVASEVPADTTADCVETSGDSMTEVDDVDVSVVDGDHGPITADDAGSCEETVRAELGFIAPLLGWDAVTGEEVRWHPAGPGQSELQNGHTEVWGSSGMGKTQFVMSLLGQLSIKGSSRFGIADFKNDYSADTGFPAYANSEFIDLWNDGAKYNPLALDDVSPRLVRSAIIEIRDTVDEAVKSVNARLGVRQKAKLEKALTASYAAARLEGRWPTLQTLDDHLDEDLRGVIGDLTSNDLFRSGEPLGDVVGSNVVFGLSRIPGNGQTTILAAGFILSALLLKVQSLPPVPNTIRYVCVVDEAHRVAPFRAIHTMIREGRSKGLAVILATQGPMDLPDVVSQNAQTKICFGLPDATVATMAARKLQPDNRRLPEQIRTLGRAEAFISFAGSEPRLIRVAQAYRDSVRLGLPPLTST